MASQIKEHFLYVPHDDYEVPVYYKELLKASRLNTLPVLAECPFRISVLISDLKRHGAQLKLFFIIEKADVVRSRYEQREQKRIPSMHLTRIQTVRERAREYGAPTGTSQEILNLLKSELTHHRVRTASIIPMDSTQTENWD